MGKRAWASVLGALGALGAIVAVRALPRDAEAAPASVPADPPREPTPGAAPVLVELFTSEGCSSCPPADAILAQLERAQPVAGARVVPLGMHIDYWDRLGWTDPFSSAAWSSRQRTYAGLGAGSYTPQAVVDGRTDVVGSRGAALEKAIADAAQRPHASVAIAVAPRDDAFEVTVAIGALPPGSAADAEAVVALTQARVRVVVARGENGGSTLEHTAVARELRVAGSAPMQGATLRSIVKPPAGVAAGELRVVAFVQERASRRVLGTGTHPLVTRE
ncbi:MAG TPA: DUF1223 domain-containing protein [Labilithrix sp.]